MDIGQSVKALNNKEFKGVSLCLLLVVPFVTHILVAVVIVGYLSLKNCQDTVDQLANQLTDKISNAIDDRLDSYIKIPQQINQLNTDAIASGTLNINNAEHHLLKQMQIFDASRIRFKLITGEFIEVNRLPSGGIALKTTDLKNKNQIYTYTTDSQGNNRQLIHTNDYKLDLGADAVKTNKPNWSQVYRGKEAGNANISISANSPIYDRHQQIIGVTSSELALENISKFLRSLEISRTGQVFIIERNGSLVASSSDEQLLTSNNGRLNALNSKTPTIQATAKYLQQKFGDFRAIKDSQKVEFEREHDLQVVRVEPWQDNYGLDWLIVVVVPENDFMAQVHANAQVILILGLVALFTSTSLGLTISRFLLNLLGNAIKFTNSGKVNLIVQGKQGSDRHYTLSFAVEDTGLGIAPHEIENLFEPFMQTETGRNSQQGTGLGLPISRKFVQLMGGDITVSSTLGKGTIFRFDIQVETVPAIELKSLHQRVLGLEPGQPEYRILVVDDRYENRRLLTKLLTPIGFQVREAENGQEAIALWQSWEPHLIWMDMRMPVLNGYEATKHIKSYLQGQATAIVALTASILEEEKAIALAAGCDDFVRKPFREEVIWEKMAQYLGVRYIYEQKAQLASEQTVPGLLLQPSCLEVMPAEWIEKLHYAATQLDAAQMLELIAQIPEQHTPLAQALRQKVNDFDFDQILNLTQCVPCI